MRDGLPFSKPRVRLHGVVGEAQAYLGEAYNLLFKVRQFCEASGTRVFSMSRAMPDGAVVTAAIVGGEEIVSCSPPLIERRDALPRRKRPIVEKIASFYAVPSSLEHAGGYIPQHPDHPDVAYPGPSSVWAEYDKSETPPDAAPKAPESERDELTPSLTVEQHPGALTWFNPELFEGNLPIVVSWRGAPGRYGRACHPPELRLFSGSEITSTTHLENVEGATVFVGKQFAASSVPRENRVWVNGRPYQINVPVWSAALKQEPLPSGELGMFLYVMSKHRLYRGLIPKTKKGPNDLPLVLNLDLLGQFQLGDAQQGDVPGLFELWQAPFFNASCTAVALLYDTYNSSREIHRTVLAEGVLDGFSAAQVMSGEYSNFYGDSNAVSTETLSDEQYSLSRTDTFGEWRERHQGPLAADYIGDQLVFLKHDSVWTTGALTQVSSVLKTHEQPGVAEHLSFNRTTTKEPSTVRIKIVHSVLGQMVEFVRAVNTPTDTIAYDGSQVGVLTFSNIYSGRLPYAGSGAPGGYVGHDPASSYRGVVIGGDLRHDSFVCGALFLRDASYIEADGAWTATFFGVGYNTYLLSSEGVGRRDIASHTDFRIEAEYAVVVKAAEVFRTSGYCFVYKDTRTISAAPGAQTTGYANTSSTAYEVASPQFNYASAPAYFDNPPQEDPWAVKMLAESVNDRPALSASFAFSPDGKHGYIGWQCHDIRDENDALLGRPSYEAFVIEDEVFPITAETYAPGGASTLAAPVFFGHVVSREEVEEG